MYIISRTKIFKNLIKTNKLQGDDYKMVDHFRMVKWLTILGGGYEGLTFKVFSP